MLPKDYAGKTKDKFYEAPVGTGPFVWDHWNKGAEIKLKKNPGYWDTGKPALDSVTWKLVTDDNARALFDAGLVHACVSVDYPDAEREREIVRGQVPDLDERIARQVVDTIGRLRDLELKKAPSIAESVDWARTLVALEIGDLDERAVADTLGVVLKHASDQERAVKELRLPR